MKRYISLLALVGFVVLSAVAEQVLVFRNGGKVDSFRSEDLREILTTSVDATSVDCGEVKFQHFVSADTTVVIPISEIDSVAFGSRNSIVPKPTARRILEEELPYITRIDATHITYNASAPPNAIPTKGAKIFYDGFSEAFPYGLTASVVAVTRNGDETVVEFAEVNPEEVFDEYFISGDFELNVPVEALAGRSSLRAPYMEKPFELAYENLGLSTKGVVKISFTNVVASVLTHYYHANITIDVDFGLEIDINTQTQIDIQQEVARHTLLRGVVGGVLYPRLDAAIFLDIEAYARLKYEMKQNFVTHYEWFRDNGQNYFLFDREENANQSVPKSEIQLLLEGRIHDGLVLDLSLSTLFDRVGVGVSAKIGPELKAEFGIGMVQDLSREFNAENYSKAVIDGSWLTRIQSYYYHPDATAWHNTVYNELPFSAEWRFNPATITLLPVMFSCARPAQTPRQPGVPSVSQPGVSIATATDTDIATPVEVSLELVRMSDDSVLARETMADKIESGKADKQGFSTILPLGGELPDDLYARPTVRYADHDIKCQPVFIRNDVALAPVYANMSGAGSYFVAGAPIQGLTTNDNTVFVVGNILPVGQIGENIYTKNERTFKTVQFINNDGTQSGGGATIYGNWTGEYHGVDIHLTINADGTAKYAGEQASLKLNSPQAGVLQLSFADGRTLLIWIHEIHSGLLTISFENSSEIIELKQ